MKLFGFRLVREPSSRRLVSQREMQRLGRHLGIAESRLALHRRGLVTPEIDAVLDQVRAEE